MNKEFNGRRNRRTKNGIIRRLSAAMICLVLLLAMMGTGLAAKEKKHVVSPELGEALLYQWYYVPSTVPSTVPEMYLEQMTIGTITLESNSSNYRYQGSANQISVTFKSGEEALKDALRVDGNMIVIDNDQMTVPGTAVFHIKAESDSAVLERDYPLTVLDWNEHPLFVIDKEDPVLKAEPGKTFRGADLVACAGALNYAAIADEVLKIHYRTEKDEDYFPLSGMGHFRLMDYTGLKYDDTTSLKLDRQLDSLTLFAPEVGRFRTEVIYMAGNILLDLPVTVDVRGYQMTADRPLTAGAPVQYQITGSTEGRTFTWSVEGEGASIDAQTGILTVTSEAMPWTVFTVTATADNGDTVQRSELYAGVPNCFEGAEFKPVQSQGFLVPAPSGAGWNYSQTDRESDILIGHGENLTMDAKWFLPDDGFAENPDIAIKEIQYRLDSFTNKANKDVQTEVIQIDSHPAGLATFSTQDSYLYHYNVGELIYIRNNRYLQIRVYSQDYNPEKLRQVTMDDLKVLAYRLGYDPENAPFTAEKATLRITAKDGTEVITEGKTLQMTAAFDDTETVNKKAKNDGVAWSVVQTETGEPVSGVTISDKGVLKVNKGLEAPVDLTVKAVSVVFGTEAVLQVKAIPVVKGIRTEPAELFFYTGTEDSAVLRAVLDPETVPPAGLTWTAAKKDIAEVTPAEDGTATVRPLKDGKTTITVKEPGGKSAKVNVSVVAPVEAIELTVKGSVKPGATVTVSAALQPKNAGNKNVEWSLDVAEDIATINTKGQVKISKEAASGTKITVTCTALGAPEPVAASAEIVIP